MGNGIFRLGVRLTIQTEDDQIISVTYSGISNCPKEARDRFLRETFIAVIAISFTARRSLRSRSAIAG